VVDRVERLTNLVALLLETPQPVSLVEIGAELAGQYPDSIPARRAAFERDKASLREIGIPIETEVVIGGPYAGQTRYRIDRRAYELADVDLDDDEVRAIQVAVATVRTGTTTGRDAIWKIGGALVDPAAPVSANLPELPELPVLRTAVARRSTIEFGYRGDDRRVDPWGLLLRRGFWYVLGFDHDRSERRTFRVDRFDTATLTLGPAGAFERDPAFDPRTAFPSDPKEIGADGDGVEAVIRIDAVHAAGVERELGTDRVLRRGADGSIDVQVPAHNTAAFRSWVLGFLDRAVVLEPAEVRDDIVAWLRTVGGR
jgi:predicted DNA-binding transcriptional regulator YafY